MNTFIVDLSAWTLLHFVWQGTLLGLAAWALLRALPHRSPQARYVAALMILVAMAVCPAATMATLWPAHSARIQPIVPLTPGLPAVPARSFDYGAPIDWTSWILAAWCFGVFLMAARETGGWWLAWRGQRRGRGPLPAEWLVRAESLAMRLGLKRRVAFYTSGWASSPQVFGWLKPVVLVPLSCVTALPAAQLEALLAHELAHVRRHDYLVNLLQALVETVLFYHPAVWWLSSRIREEREACCDAVAAEVCGDAVLLAVRC